MKDKLIKVLGIALIATSVQAGPGHFFGTDQIIIKVEKHQSQPRSTAELAGKKIGHTMRYLRVSGNGAHVLKLDKFYSNADVRAIANKISNQPVIEYAEPDTILQRAYNPNDSLYSFQWHYANGTGGINLPAAWYQSKGSSITIAVVDTGYVHHPDLEANMLNGYDMMSDASMANDGDGRDSDASDPGDSVKADECGYNHPDYSSSWHGTHVAGTVSASTNNEIGVAGVAFEAKVLPVRVLGKCGGYLSDIADGVIWASGGEIGGVTGNLYPARVINLSLGGSGSCSNTMQSAINQANDNSSVIVVAAGNSSSNTRNFTPANCRNVITVAATNRSDAKAYYSNSGKEVDLSAPGGDTRLNNGQDGILSTINEGIDEPVPVSADNPPVYAFYQGTSMAAPHVAGVAALMLSKNPDLSVSDVESLLKSSTRSFPSRCPGCGKGILDANAAVTAAANASSGGSDDGGDSGNDAGSFCARKPGHPKC